MLLLGLPECVSLLLGPGCDDAVQQLPVAAGELLEGLVRLPALCGDGREKWGEHQRDQGQEPGEGGQVAAGGRAGCGAAVAIPALCGDSSPLRRARWLVNWVTAPVDS